VVPAFVDTHMHFASFALFHSGLDCRHTSSLSELWDLIRDHIDRNPSDKLHLGFGCSAHTLREKQLPTGSDLDAVTSMPLMLIKYDGHAAVANRAMVRHLPTAVLKCRGYCRQSGWFYQEAFYRAVNALTRSVSLLKNLKTTIRGADALIKKGIGLAHTSEGVGFPLDMDVNLMRFVDRGLPPVFRTYFQTLAVSKVRKRNLPRIGGCFETALDGCFGSQDAALRASYHNNPDSTGFLAYTPKQIDTFVHEAHRSNLQVALHAIGDAAIAQALDAYEAAQKRTPRDDPRHIIIHADLMTPDLIERAAQMNVAIALQSPFLMWPQEPLEYLESLLGDRIQHLIPIKSMLDAGLLLGNGSDAPCTLPDPIFGIHTACNHPVPEERISPLEALKMHTSWAARLSFDENQRGTLTPGKQADFLVLDRNLLTIPKENLKETKIEDIYLSGRRYQGFNPSTAKFLYSCIRKKSALP
jgi:predicted amidohydrolase YtcJ